MKRILCLLAFLTLCISASAQLQFGRAWRIYQIPGIPTSVEAGATVSLVASNCEFALIPRGGVGIVLSFQGQHAADTNAVSVTFNVGVVPGVATSAPLLTFTALAAGTNLVHTFTNVPPSFAGNARYLYATSIVNGNTNAGLTNIVLTGCTPGERR